MPREVFGESDSSNEVARYRELWARAEPLDQATSPIVTRRQRLRARFDPHLGGLVAGLLLWMVAFVAVLEGVGRLLTVLQLH